MPVPDDPSDYPGNTNLAEMGIPRDELATKIQKVFRGKLSREHGIDLTVEERRAEALKQYYDPFKYSKAVNKLRNLNVRDKELHQEQEKKRLKMLIANRKHFLGMDSKELVLTADRDPFQEKKLQIESNQTYEDLLADKLRPSQVEGGLKLDKLKWDVEESKISPDFSERRRSRGGRGRLNANRNTLSNTDLGYSDEIEFDLQNTGDSSSTPGKSSLGMESFIEDLAHSRSMSKSRSRGRIRGFRDQRGMESKEESIIDNESSGFGFIKNEVKGDKGNMRLEARVDINEDSDSNPFGVEKKADLYPTTSNNRQKPQDKPIAEIFYPQDPTSKHKNQRPDPAFDGQGLKYVLDRPGEVYLGLDPSIYGPLREKSKYTPKVESVHQAGSSNSKAILGTLANIAASMKHNNQAIQEISTVPQQVGQRPGPIVSEADRKQRMNEKLSVKLLEQITAARENMFNPDQLADLLTPIVKAQLQTPQPREELRSSPHSRADPLSENFFSTETFMQLYLNALKSRDEIAILDDQRHEATIRHLEDQIRRLTFAEDKLQDAVQKNKLLIEEEKDDILRRFAQALQERREKRDAQWKKKQGRPPEPQKPKGREGISPLNLTDLNKNSPTTKNKPSKLFDRAVAEESAESGTIVSDYNESRERIESISWVDSASTKQQKFTTFN